MKKKLLIVVVLMVAAVGCTAQAAEQPSSAPVEYEDSGITAEMLVDYAGPSMTAEFCANYDILGYELSLAAFEQGYNEPDPSAQEVVDELVSRC
jgi:hypothetical protein